MSANFKFSYASGLSYARGLTIDPLLLEEDVAILYERWSNEWGEPLEFQGGAKAITCDMVARVPMAQMVKVYGKARANRYYLAAEPFKEV